MASIKVKFRPSNIADHEGAIYYQVIHERRVRQLLSDYRVFRNEWDETRSMVTSRHDSDRWPLIMSIRERISWDVERLLRIDRRMEASGMVYTADDVIEEFTRYSREYSLFNFMEGVIARLKQNGRMRTSETYKSALNSFRRFLSDTMDRARQPYPRDVMLDSLTSDMMEAYQAWHKSRGVAPNTVSFYARILRAVYNRAVEQGIIENRHPFRRVYTGVDKTVKRALPLRLISRIMRLCQNRRNLFFILL